MRTLYGIAIALNFFILILNGAFFWIGSALEQPQIIARSNNFLETNATIAEQVDSVDTSANAFNPALIFGDFLGGINLFINFVSGGFIFGTLQGFGFDIYLITLFQVIVGVTTLFSIIYLLSGRA